MHHEAQDFTLSVSKKMKIILMTKDEKYLIKHWIDYHGEIFGYDNLHIIDDSDDRDILKYYETIENLGITFHRNSSSNLNNLDCTITSVMQSLKDTCDFIIKLDTDEFIGYYDKNTNEISVSKDDIINSINSLDINGNKYRILYYVNSAPLIHYNYPLECTTFHQPEFTPNHKVFFYSQTFEYCDLGAHCGRLVSGYDSNIYNKSDLIIVSYHFPNPNQYVANCKRACLSHQFISEEDSIETQIIKLQSHMNGLSSHKAKDYYNYLITESGYTENYYNKFKNLDSIYTFDKLYSKLYKKKKCIVITTINNPTSQILHYTNIPDWDVIIVGDSKTNDSAYENIKCIYLGLDQQKEMFPSIYDLIPLKSYTRKMFGYLYAIKNKYDVIYDTDDDNQFIWDINKFNENRPIKTSNTLGFANIYKCFTDENIWPRGIPPKHSSIDIIPVISDTPPLLCAVIQGLVNNDPDVDAYYRINIQKDSFNFEKNIEYDIALGKGCVCPFNTQNTFWVDPSMFYAMYLPVSVTFRYTDILRGFVALYQLWKNDKTIKFTAPSAIQYRNDHNLSEDYESEVIMYQTADKVIALLNKNMDASIQDMYRLLADEGIVGKNEIEVLNEWMKLSEYLSAI